MICPRCHGGGLDYRDHQGICCWCGGSGKLTHPEPDEEKEKVVIEKIKQTLEKLRKRKEEQNEKGKE